MRPQLKPALRVLWRDPSTLQVGVVPGHAVAIGGFDPAVAKLVQSLDGTRDLAAVAQAAQELGVDRRQVERLLRLLGECDVLEDAAAERGFLRSLARGERDRLAPDLAAASLARGGDDGGARVMAARHGAAVVIHGAGRVGASASTLLAAAGVGTVSVHDQEIAAPADVAPAGIATDAVGARRQDAAVQAAQRVTRSVRHRRSRTRDRPDLALVTHEADDVARLSEELVREGIPHLFASVTESTGVVGPLVLPGRSSCRRCHHLHRSDRDPAWPGIAAQLSGRAASAPGACDIALATAVAAHAVLQVLAVLDGVTRPPAVDGTIEIRQADGVVRRRSWAPHPACGCTWSTE